MSDRVEYEPSARSTDRIVAHARIELARQELEQAGEALVDGEPFRAAIHLHSVIVAASEASVAAVRTLDSGA